MSAEAGTARGKADALPRGLPFSRLIGLLALIYPALLLYGSLFPLLGWTDSGVRPLAFLGAPFPRYWTLLDLLANLGLYLPLGFFWTIWLRGSPHLQRFWWCATLAAVALSFGVEVTQNWLPSRVASNIDLLCNALGALTGALLARYFGPRWLAAVDTWAARWLIVDASGELGLLLLVLWFVGQWVPEGALFVSGDWRAVWTGWPPDWAPSFGETAAVRLESAAVACYLLVVGLMLRELLFGQRRQRLAGVFLFFVCAVTARAIAAAFMVRPAAAFDWLTFGAESGLLAGSLMLVFAFYMPARLRCWMAVVALLCGTLAINLAGPNPYGLSVLPPGSGGSFTNFAGLTELVAVLWPLAALVWWVSRLRRSPIMAG